MCMCMQYIIPTMQTCAQDYRCTLTRHLSWDLGDSFFERGWQTLTSPKWLKCIQHVAILIYSQGYDWQTTTPVLLPSKIDVNLHKHLKGRWYGNTWFTTEVSCRTNKLCLADNILPEIWTNANVFFFRM